MTGPTFDRLVPPYLGPISPERITNRTVPPISPINGSPAPVKEGSTLAEGTYIPSDASNRTVHPIRPIKGSLAPVKEASTLDERFPYIPPVVSLLEEFTTQNASVRPTTIYLTSVSIGGEAAS